MPLETGTFVADLVTTNPPTSDLETQGANHLQLIKSVLQNTFGVSVRRIVGLPTVQTKSANYTFVAADCNSTFFVSTAGGAVTLTMPNNVLGAADAGWEVTVIKSTSDSNPIFLVPFSGTFQSGEYTGLSKARRCIPGRRTRIVWTGSSFYCERVMPHPISALIDYTASKTLPVGFEWPNGQTLSSSANYPEYFALTGSLVVPDLRGRSSYGQDDMGGVAASRITNTLNFDGTILNNTGGLQSHVQTTGEMASHGHSGSGNVNDPQHSHSQDGNTLLNVGGASAGAFTGNNFVKGGTTGSSSTGITVPSLNINSSGSGNAFTILGPAMTHPKLLVVE